MPLIQVTMIEGRTADQKRALLEALTQAVQDTIGASLDSIRVWITDVPSEQFMSAGALAADNRPAEPPPPSASPLGEAHLETPGTPPGPSGDPVMASGEPSPLP